MEDTEINENIIRKKRHLSNDSDTGDNIVSDLVYKKQKLDEVGGDGTTINEIGNYNSFPKSKSKVEEMDNAEQSEEVGEIDNEELIEEVDELSEEQKEKVVEIDNEELIEVDEMSE